MKVFTAQSTKSTPKDAVRELKEIFNSQNSEAKNIKAITFFASSNYEPSDLIAAMNESFPDITVWGCTTCGEIISGCISANSIVAMAFTSEVIEDIKIEVVTDISKNIDLLPAIESFEEYYKAPIAELDFTKFFGLIYIDGLSKKEEVLLDKLGNYTNIPFIGGSAGDDNKFIRTIIYANGKHYDNSAVLALVKPKVKYGIEKIQSFTPTEHTVVVTKTDEANRIINELNNEPALDVYANLLNIKAESLIDGSNFEKYVFGLIASNGTPFIRSPFRVVDDGKSLELFCSVKKNTELRIMESADIIVDTKNSLEKIQKKYRKIFTMLCFDCMGRHWTLHNNNQLDEYSKLFSDTRIPIVGFKTCGEAFIAHINHTAVFLVFYD